MDVIAAMHVFCCCNFFQRHLRSNCIHPFGAKKCCSRSTSGHSTSGSSQGRSDINHQDKIIWDHLISFGNPAHETSCWKAGTQSPHHFQFSCLVGMEGLQTRRNHQHRTTVSLRDSRRTPQPAKTPGSAGAWVSRAWSQFRRPSGIAKWQFDALPFPGSRKSARSPCCWWFYLGPAMALVARSHKFGWIGRTRLRMPAIRRLSKVTDPIQKPEYSMKDTTDETRMKFPISESWTCRPRLLWRQGLSWLQNTFGARGWKVIEKGGGSILHSTWRSWQASNFRNRRFERLQTALLIPSHSETPPPKGKDTRQKSVQHVEL